MLHSLLQCHHTRLRCPCNNRYRTNLLLIILSTVYRPSAREFRMRIQDLRCGWEMSKSAYFTLKKNEKVPDQSQRAKTHGWIRGATTAEKLRGTKVWVGNRGACAPRPARGRAGGECGRGPSRCEGPGWGITPGKFLKTQMLNPAFWWLLCSLVGSRGRAFWKLRPKSWGPIYCWSPKPKRWGTSLPRSPRLLRLWAGLTIVPSVSWHRALPREGALRGTKN